MRGIGQRIRVSEPSDKQYVSELLVQAMGSLASFFTSGSDYLEQISLFGKFFTKKNNQYSFENTIVFEEDGIIKGSSNGYDGSKLSELRKEFFSYIKKKYNVIFPSSLDETQEGEFYIDCVSVFDEYQRKGIGKQLIMSMLEKGRAMGFKKAGLLVDKDNINAISLYKKIGFKFIEEKIFMNEIYCHMQIDI